MDKRYITGIIFLILAVITGVVFTDAKYREMLFLSDALLQKENEFQGQQLLVREVESLSKEFSANIKDLEKIDRYIPKTKNIADLLVQMDYMTLRNGLIMKDVSFSSNDKKNTVGKGEYSIVTVNLSLAGSYNSFLNFSEDVRSSKHLMDIISFDVKAEKSNENTSNDDGDFYILNSKISQEPVLYFNVKINTYYQ